MSNRNIDGLIKSVSDSIQIAWDKGYREGLEDGKEPTHETEPQHVESVGEKKDCVEIVRCKDCRWGREVCGNIECLADSNIPEYHGYEWFCPIGERKEKE